MNCSVVSWQDMMALVGVVGRGIGFDEVQGWSIQTSRARRDEGEVMKEVLKSVWEFCGCLFCRDGGKMEEDGCKMFL